MLDFGVGVAEAGGEDADEGLIARGGVGKNDNGLDAEGGIVVGLVEHVANGGDGGVGSGTKPAKSGEDRGLDLGIGVGQSFGELFDGAGDEGRIAPRARAAVPADAWFGVVEGGY